MFIKMKEKVLYHKLVKRYYFCDIIQTIKIFSQCSITYNNGGVLFSLFPI